MRHAKKKGSILDSELLIRKRKLAPEAEADRLCEDCQRIDFSSILNLDAAALQDDLRSGIFVADLGNRLHKAGESDCPLCRLLSQMRIHAPGLRQDGEFHLRAYSGFNQFNSLRLGSCPKRLLAKDLPCLAMVSTCLTNAAIPDSEVKFLFCKSTSSDQKTIFIPRLIPTLVDFSMMRDIVGYCKSKHQNLCCSFKPVVHGMRLINCNKNAQTASALDLYTVDSECPPYIALSYVWGKFGDFSGDWNHDDDNVLPRVVTDAIIVTKGLGYDYLWVDKYCIDQHNASERDLQISRMDAVYNAAELTIIAATGTNANSGLAGVGTTPRAPQQSLTIGSIQVIASMHVPSETIKSSTWNSRAWTFQEGILPRRRLVFTAYEVYFECESMHWRESWEADLDELHSHGRLRKFFNAGPFAGRPLSSGTVARSCFENLKRFDYLVREYSTRQFSLNFGETDSLRAFQGITSFFERSKYPVYQLWGLPFTLASDCSNQTPVAFVASLLWRHTTSVLSHNSKPQRRKACPSWTWAGWAGEVVFPFRHSTGSSLFISKLEKIGVEVDQHPEEHVDLSSPLFVSNIEKFHSNQSRILRFKGLRLLPTQSKFKIRLTNDGWDTPNVVLGHSGFKAVIHLSGGNVTRRTFQNLFLSGKFDFVLLTAETVRVKDRRKPCLTFLIIDSSEESPCRAGIMVVKTDLETFTQEFTLMSDEICLS